MDNTLHSQVRIQAPIEFGYIFSDEDRVSIESVLCQCSRERLINLAVLLNRNDFVATDKSIENSDIFLPVIKHQFFYIADS